MTRPAADTLLNLALSILLWLGVSTIWLERHWTVAALEAAAFGLTGIALWTRRKQALPRVHPALWLLVAVSAWGVVQIGAGWTLAAAETEWAALYWLAAACFFYLGSCVADRERFLDGLLWFAAAMASLMLAQLFTSDGKILWLIPTAYDDRVFGVFPSYNNYAAFIELVFPLALWRAFEGRRNWWIHSGVAALMYASVIASTSRAGAALVTAELILTIVLAARRNRVEWRRVVVVLSAATVFTLLADRKSVV